MPRFKDLILHPISSTFGYLLGWIVHPKSGPLMAGHLGQFKGQWGHKKGWKDETCTVDDFNLAGVSYTPENYKDSNGVIICFWGNGDFYQTKQSFMEKLGKKFNKKVISFNNRGVNINTITRSPIADSEIVNDAVTIAKKYINEDNRDNSFIYGHSIGGAQAVHAGYRLLQEGIGVKVYSWNSLRSISATAREMLAPIAKYINIAVGTMAGITLSFALPFIAPNMAFSLLASTISSLVTSTGISYLLNSDHNKSLAHTLFLNPILRLGGWDFNCEKEGEALLKANKLHYGNIDHDGVIKKSAQFADAMDPINIEINSPKKPLCTRWKGWDHMCSPSDLPNVLENIQDFIKPKQKMKDILQQTRITHR